MVQTYSNGIDWATLRELLNDGSKNFSAVCKRALQVVVTDAYWPEARRWQTTGSLPTGTCLQCFLGLGTARHKFGGECGAIEQEIGWLRIAGRSIADPPSDDGLPPLLELAWPPMVRDPRPRAVETCIGHRPEGVTGDMYGDGSGVGLPRRRPEVVTWSLVAGGRGIAGTCGGWFPSVPRGELRAAYEWGGAVRMALRRCMLGTANS